ncbi:hypothetical protein [Streptomyces zagrosensis]|uniref:Uncharacterized protein n=1 Tax=Streptomyces zagrosensis TaxID=1042984 RepID=A0A7W9QHC8_9ACTN|nr:hypothetical protein [Streptomyces zagrosensis]MBB5939688.1 hypothetical protein [Streptomyces zagrosensis]
MSTPAPLRVLRGTDLLDLTFSFVGLVFDNRLGRRYLVRADEALDGLLTVAFGPQHIIEEAFQEESPTPPANAPVGSLISGRSVLVFEVRATDAILYSETGLLEAMRDLPLRIVDAAREPDTTTSIQLAGPAPAQAATEDDNRLDADAPARATALVRLLRTTAELSARYGTDATLAAAAAAGAVIEVTAHDRTVTAPEPPAAAPESSVSTPESPVITAEPAATPEASVSAPAAVRRSPQDPFGDPVHPYTGIELPYRLLLSPSQRAQWIHRGAIDPEPGERVELWHTRLTHRAGLPQDRTVRAVWNRDRGPDPGAPETFTASLSAAHRNAIVELTSNDGLTTPEGQPFTPLPVAVDTLMLSAVGGWLDSLGQWPSRPSGITLSEWRHRAAMGRDHYVRVMFSGFLCPFGHRADLIQVTERKFDDARAAYLFQRRFIVVRQPLRTYDVKRALPIGAAETSPLANVQFPFTSVRIDTLVTPNLTNDIPTPESCHFFPATRAETPFRFKVTAVDHEGRTVEFRTPLLFLTEDRGSQGQLAAIVAEYNALAPMPLAASDASFEPAPETTADLLGQAVALAPSFKPDDTSLDVAQMVWGVEAPPGLHTPSLSDTHFFPQLRWAAVTVPAVSQLSGNDFTVPVTYAKRFTESGFSQIDQGLRKANLGEVFVNVLPVLGAPDLPLAMNFGKQSDRSGGLVAPSFDVAGLSRKTGPVSGVVAGGADALESIANGTFEPTDFFHASDVLGLLGANLLGILPLADLVKKAGLDQPLKVPNFFTESINAVTGFLSELRRIRDLIENEAERYSPAGRRVLQTAEALVKVIGAYLAQALSGKPGPIDLAQIDTAFNAFDAALTELLNTLPPGADPGVRALLDRVRQTVATWNNSAGQVLSLRQAVEKAGKGAKLPETINARLEWNPEIKPFPPGDPIFVPHAEPGKPTGRFSLVVDLRGSLRPDLSSGADVTCSLEEFDLVLVPSFNAMRLNFERIRFTARAGKKLDVEVAFRGVEFIGPLSFVETLRQLIPFDGFSDPPGIQVSSSGIVASYALPLPNLAVGVFSLENLRLAAYLNLPFIGKSLEVGFSFCTRQAPFRLTVSMLGGGGFFGIVLTPKRVAVLEAALEFGAAVSMNLGVASGSLSVMAGIYFRLELDSGEARLAGYFRARGEVDVLGIVSASIELYLELTWQPGKVSGRAKITISIHIGFWSQSVTIECEKTFVGGGESQDALAGPAPEAVRPPTFAQMMSPYPDPVTGARRDPVDEYCTAFAEVS